MNKNVSKVRRWQLRQQEKIRAIKEATPCARCGELFPYFVTDFHHRDPKTKLFKINETQRSTKAWQRVLDEIAKCDLLCSNCHRFAEHEERTKVL